MTIRSKRRKAERAKQRLHPAAEQENYIRRKKQQSPEAEGSSHSVTETTGTATPDVTDTTGEHKGLGSLLRDPGHIRSDLQMLRTYMGCGVFSEDQIEGMLVKIAKIVATGKNREQISAFKTLLAQAKLSHDMAQQQERPDKQTTHVHQHGHLHVAANGVGSELAAIAAEIGLQIDIEETGGDEGDYVEGSAGRAQQEE